MSAHTEGRLVLDRFAIVNETTLEKIAHLPDGKAAAANGRRLIASWNACKGIPTETLELVPKFEDAGIRSTKSLVDARDELIEALRKNVDRCVPCAGKGTLIVRPDRFGNPTGPFPPRACPTCADGRALLAKHAPMVPA
jgi:hypothetical protein